MSQPQPSQDWPAWITAAVAVIGIIGIPLGFLWRRIFGSVTRKEFKEYLLGRDELSTQRHNENRSRLDIIAEDLQDARERMSNIEGRITGQHRRP